MTISDLFIDFIPLKLNNVDQEVIGKVSVKTLDYCHDI
jgi:hypothetical protein